MEYKKSGIAKISYFKDRRKHHRMEKEKVRRREEKTEGNRWTDRGEGEVKEKRKKREGGRNIERNMLSYKETHLSIWGRFLFIQQKGKKSAFWDLVCNLLDSFSCCLLCTCLVNRTCLEPCEKFPFNKELPWILHHRISRNGCPAVKCYTIYYF